MIEYECTVSECEEEIQNVAKHTVDFVLKEFDLPNMYVELLITDDDKIQQLNRDYRNIDRTTDVLSFPNYDVTYESGNLTDSDSMPQCLGSLALSYKKACDQAVEYGHSLKREMAFLITHGMLHLLGYDHIEPEEEKEMKEIAYDILNKLNIKRED